ncbi:hypothetical protein [Algibacter pacificus]|uniref:hypothetical protein n=1 Tax=Algibacter pacificus TaxID=2599389 RepID=UPI0011CC909F|nr:hypothetical protein [Algibacter pacificus]
MKQASFILFFFTVSIFAQEPIETSFIKETKLDVDHLVAINNFGATYYITKNVFYKRQNQTTLSYNNLQLGNLTGVNTFNPLKINLFYQDFNTLIILDNRLSEIYRVDFNNLKNYKNVSYTSTGHDNTVWIFNQTNQKLELFDYKLKHTRAETQPIQSTVLDLKSNYNRCWLLTKKFLYIYNYFGSLLEKIPNNNFNSIAILNENLILKKDNRLFYLNENNLQPIALNLSNFIINRFFVMNETLYIYNQKTLQEFHLKIK